MKIPLILFVLLSTLGIVSNTSAAKTGASTASYQVSAGCMDDLAGSDLCTVTITGLASGKAYQVEVVNNCSGVSLFIPFTANGASYSNSNITPPNPLTEGCSVSFYLLTTGGRQLAPGFTTSLI